MPKRNLSFLIPLLFLLLWGRKLGCFCVVEPIDKEDIAYARTLVSIILVLSQNKLYCTTKSALNFDIALIHINSELSL